MVSYSAHTHALSTLWLLRSTFIINLVANVSMLYQSRGLSNESGLAPLEESVNRARGVLKANLKSSATAYGSSEDSAAKSYTTESLGRVTLFLQCVYQIHAAAFKYAKSSASSDSLRRDQRDDAPVLSFSCCSYLCKLCALFQQQTIIWLFSDSASVQNVCMFSAVGSVFGLVYADQAAVFAPFLFAGLYITYNAIRRCLPEFMSLQWDALLVEANFMSVGLSLIFCVSRISADNSRLSSLAFGTNVLAWRLLLLRLMLGSGIVKVRTCTLLYAFVVPKVLSHVMCAHPVPFFLHSF